MKIETLHKTVAHATQAQYYEEILSLRVNGDWKAAHNIDHKLKVSIKSGSCADQCTAKVLRWNGEDWKLVHERFPNQMYTPHGIAYREGADTNPGEFESEFALDRDDLLTMAYKILF